jgi:hypothetical protein
LVLFLMLLASAPRVPTFSAKRSTMRDRNFTLLLRNFVRCQFVDYRMEAKELLRLQALRAEYS